MHFAVRFFFYYHFFIGLCAAAMCSQTMMVKGIEAASHTVFLLFVFASTVFSYTAHFLLAARKSNSSDQLKWYGTHKKQSMAVLAISGTVMLSVFFSLHHIHGPITAAFLLNLSYTGPLLLKKPLQLPKLFTYFKSYVVGFVWAFVSVFLTIANAAAEIQFADLVLFFNQFMLVSLNVLIFDYRDKLPDYEFGIHTPANMLNEKQFSLFYHANLFIYAASAIGVATAYKSPVFLLQLPLAIVLAFLFHKSKKSQGELFYLFGVDGIMILALLLSLFLRF